MVITLANGFFPFMFVKENANDLHFNDVRMFTFTNKKWNAKYIV